MSRWEVVIGLEVHLQLLTDSKMFCGCPTNFGAVPNQNVCPVCLGHPGTLPVVNRRAVELGLRLAVATGSRVAPCSEFARKNYFYPDLPRGYQISQQARPLAREGHLDLPAGRRVGLTRIHLEEDAGRLVHDAADGGAHAHVDFNRAGIPLVEVVTKPEIRSPEEAATFVRTLRDLAVCLEVSDGDLERGNLRCDANVSVRRPGEGLRARTEIKNLNSFRFIRRALAREVKRQIDLNARGEAVSVETRGYAPRTDETFRLRSKEEEHDYRYFPDPDLVPIRVSDRWIEAARAELPELPLTRRTRLVTQYGLSSSHAALLASDRALGDYYEDTVAESGSAQDSARWILGDLRRELKRRTGDIRTFPIRPDELARLIRLELQGTLTGPTARLVFQEMLETGRSARDVAAGRSTPCDQALLKGLVDRIVAEHPRAVSSYRAGRSRSLDFLVGATMRAGGEGVDPRVVRALLQEALEE